MTIPAEIQNLLTQLLVAVIGLVVAVLGYYTRLCLAKLTDKIKADVGEKQFAWAKSFIETAVMAVSQNPAFAGWSGEMLKAYVMKEALAFSEKYKLSFDEAEIDLMIEEAVKWMKQSFIALPEPE
jgi:hypothetical protein